MELAHLYGIQAQGFGSDQPVLPIGRWYSIVVEAARITEALEQAQLKDEVMRELQSVLTCPR
jgi:hypothetical protein